MTQGEVILELGPGPKAPSKARQALSAIGDQMSPDARFNLQAVVSAFVTESMRDRPDAPIRVEVQKNTHGVHGAVTGGGGWQGLKARAADPRRRGLERFDAMTEDWGLDGKRAWFAV
jgi:hypothetical protein